PDCAMALEPRLIARVVIAWGSTWASGRNPVDVTAATATTQPTKQIATGAANDLSSIDSKDWSATSGSAATTASAPTRANRHGNPPGRPSTATPETRVARTSTPCMKHTGTVTATTFARTSRTGCLVPVSSRFQLVPRCSTRQTVAASTLTPIEKNSSP